MQRIELLNFFLADGDFDLVRFDKAMELGDLGGFGSWRREMY